MVGALNVFKAFAQSESGNSEIENLIGGRRETTAWCWSLKLSAHRFWYRLLEGNKKEGNLTK